MPRLHCEISESLAKVILRAKIAKFKTKGKTLKHFVSKALMDTGEYKGVYPYGNDRSTTATISNYSDEQYDKSVDYRLKWSLSTQTEFFRFALHHGAFLWELENPNNSDAAKT